jgi:hypothetical protein
MARPLPEFAPLSLKELRSLWKKYRGNEDVERLVLEVQFSRGVINEIDGYFKIHPSGMAGRESRRVGRDRKGAASADPPARAAERPGGAQARAQNS